MTKTVTIVGATGIQGGSVIKALLQDKQYQIRAITRNGNSDRAQALSAQGVEIVEADLNDLESLKVAFRGSYAIYAVTNFFDAWPSKVSLDEGIKLEIKYGTNLAKAAAATADLEHYIWSTLPNSRRNTHGEIVVPYYDSKNQVDDFLRADAALWRKTTLVWVTSYGENIQYPFYKPFPVPGASPDQLFSFWGVPVDTTIYSAGQTSTNVGLFVKAALEHPDQTRGGKVVLVQTETLTPALLTAMWAAKEGKKATTLQVDKQVYLDMWPNWGNVMDLSHSYWAYMKGNAFSGEPVILTAKDLEVTGLVDTQAAFAKM